MNTPILDEYCWMHDGDGNGGWTCRECLENRQAVFTASQMGWRAAARGEVMTSYNFLLRWVAAYGPLTPERQRLIVEAYGCGVTAYAEETGIQFS